MSDSLYVPLNVDRLRAVFVCARKACGERVSIPLTDLAETGVPLCGACGDGKDMSLESVECLAASLPCREGAE